MHVGQYCRFVGRRTGIVESHVGASRRVHDLLQSASQRDVSPWQCSIGIITGALVSSPLLGLEAQAAACNLLSPLATVEA